VAAVSEGVLMVVLCDGDVQGVENKDGRRFWENIFADKYE